VQARGKISGRYTRAAAPLFALLLVTILAWPWSAANLPSDGKSGTYTLAPRLSPRDNLHQFGFRLTTSDLIYIRFTVSPAGAVTMFGFHLHTTTGIVYLLNATSGNYTKTLTVPSEGFYMPQWVNPNDFPVNLTYTVLIYNNGLGLALPNIPTTLLLLLGSLGGAVGGLQAFLWWRGRRQGRGV
jgi:hypothetical protein